MNLVILFSDFGEDAMKIVADQYPQTLKSLGVDLDAVPMAWVLLRSAVYSRYFIFNKWLLWVRHVENLVQDASISIVNMETLQSCTNPSMK